MSIMMPREIVSPTNIDCQINPKAKIVVWLMKSMKALEMNLVFVKRAEVEAICANEPAINAPTGNASKNPPLLPMKCCQPDAPPENTPNPKPPKTKYAKTDVSPTLSPNACANHTTNNDCKVVGRPAAKSIFNGPSVQITPKAIAMRIDSSTVLLPVILVDNIT